MARKKHTARMIIGGRPRTNRETTTASSSSSSTKEAIQVIGRKRNAKYYLMETTESSVISEKQYHEEQCDMCSMPVVDYDDPNVHRRAAELDSFRVQRVARMEEGTVTDRGNWLLETAMKQAKLEFPRSKWVLLWADDDLQTHSFAQEEGLDQKNIPEWCEHFDPLESILATGQLHGCNLHGNASMETPKFGLVSNMRLAKGTPVAVDSGILWSHEVHDAEMKNKGPLVGLRGNQVGAKLLKPFLSPDVAEQVQPEDDYVMCMASSGGETAEFDDPAW